MLALSVARPWAQLLAAGLKTVENRRTRPPRSTMRSDGGWIVVHASRAWMPAAIDRSVAVLGVGVLDRIGEDGEFAVTAPSGFMGVMRVGGWCDATTGRHGADSCGCGPWAEPGFRHWQITEAHRFWQPVPGPGRLGTWPAPCAVADLARELIGMVERRQREAT